MEGLFDGSNCFDERPPLVGKSDELPKLSKM